MDLKDRCGVVLGVANERSIAWAISRGLSQAGARLALNYQNERLEKNVCELAGQLPGSLCLPCDLSDDEQIDRFFDRVGKSFGGRLDFLIHSVAFANKEELAGLYMNTSRDGFQLAMDISVYSLVAATRRAVPLLRAAGGGSIVTLSFYGAEKVIPNYNVMGVAKAGLEASVRYLAADLGPDQIRVNAISAGAVKTLAARGISNFGQMLTQAAERSPMKRNVEPEEIAATACFLCSPGGAGITGETLHVDTGFHCTGA